MKIKLKYSLIFAVVSTLLVTTSCRTELDEEIGAPIDETLRANSKVATLILKTVLKDGSYDNLLDDSSCFNVQLPVNLIINDEELTITSEEDFDRILEILDASDDDLDQLNFVFPITLIASDFTEILIENEDQLEELIEDCEQEDEDDDIECIDFQYPITFSLFNETSEVLETITFNNDNELYDFIRDFNETDIVNIRFPITMVLSDGTELIINNLEDLENSIEDAADDCDENDISNDNFNEVLTSELLEVQKYKDNESNETSNYSDYVFNFAEDGSVVIENQNDGSITNGTWSLETRNDGGLDLTLDFGNEAPLNKLNNMWNVKKVQEKRIMLDEREGAGISKDELFFDQI